MIDSIDYDRTAKSVEGSIGLHLLSCEPTRLFITLNKKVKNQFVYII